MPYDQLGKLLIGAAVALFVVGLVFVLLGRTTFFGRLPGDINISNGNFTCIAPIASMLVLSLLLTIIVNIVLRLLNK